MTDADKASVKIKRGVDPHFPGQINGNMMSAMAIAKINLSFIITNIKNKWTDLCGNSLLQNNFMHTFFEINSSLGNDAPPVPGTDERQHDECDGHGQDAATDGRGGHADGRGEPTLNLNSKP